MLRKLNCSDSSGSFATARQNASLNLSKLLNFMPRNLSAICAEMAATCFRQPNSKNPFALTCYLTRLIPWAFKINIHRLQPRLCWEPDDIIVETHLLMGKESQRSPRRQNLDISAGMLRENGCTGRLRHGRTDNRAGVKVKVRGGRVSVVKV